MNTILIIANVAILLNSLKSTEDKNNDSSSTPSFLLMISRHGARVPNMFVPGDPNINYWQEQKGQLTNIGKNELYLLGQLTRSRYRDLLDILYKPEEIEVRCTKSDRTQMSAQCFLAGFYPPKHAQVWNPNLAWQPIPVHVLDYNINMVIYKVLITKFAICSSDTREDTFLLEHKDLIEVIQNASSIRYAKCMDPTFYLLLDTFIIEKFYNLTLPFGLDSKYEDIRKLRNAFIVRWWTAPEMISGVNGPLFRDVIDALTMKSNDTIKQKAHAYFMHDTNVLIFLAAVTNYSLEAPSFAASISIELHNSTDGFNVKVYYTNSPTSARKIQYIKGCGYICPLEDFIELLRRAMIPPSIPKCICK